MPAQIVVVISEYFEDHATRYEQIACSLRAVYPRAQLRAVLYSRYVPQESAHAVLQFDQICYANSLRSARRLAKQSAADVIVCLVGHKSGLDDLVLYMSAATISVPHRIFSLRNLVSLQAALSSPGPSRKAVHSFVSKGMRNYIEASLKVHLLCLLLVPLLHIQRLFKHRQGVPSKRILVVRLDLLGDMIVSLPYLAQLRKQFPSLHLTVLTTSRGAAIIREQMAIGVDVCDRLEVWDPPWHRKRSLLGLGDVFSVVRKIRELQAGSYDQVLQPVPIGTGVMIAAMARGKATVAVIDPTLSLSRVMGGYISHPVRLSPKRNYHMRDFWEMTFKAAGLQSPAGKALALSDRETAAVMEMIGVDSSSKIVILNIGAGNRLREWGVPRFAGLIARLSRHPELKIVLIGGAADSEKAARIIDFQPVRRIVNLAGQLSLNRVASALSLADLIVTADTGIMHMAAAVDIRIVAIFGAGHVPYCRPLSDKFVIVRHELGCSGCSDICFTGGIPPCIDSVTVDEVYDAARRMLFEGEVQA